MMKRASLLSLPVRPLLQSLQALLLQRLSRPQIRKQEAIAQEIQRTNSRLCCDWEPSFRSLYGSTCYLATRLSAHFADWRIRRGRNCASKRGAEKLDTEFNNIVVDAILDVVSNKIDGEDENFNIDDVLRAIDSGGKDASSLSNSQQHILY
ncbi:hypothetical protein FCM35_KLT19337 [Carex littledalei]|uniref:Uncharacterized protein n=1 Tax=Carex littledalei TaxID=544730 RepID=A0A833RCK2_9POAL|nr:hypothetical protein FCM35_KLT19337 [Carex littledalei]